MEAKESPLIKIRTDRNDGFGYMENDQYYCIMRDARGTALYEKETNELIKTFKVCKNVRAVRFFAKHMLMIKTIDGTYFLYDIKCDSFVWEKKYNPSGQNQEHYFQITNEGIIYDIDQNVRRPNTCCLVKIDPWTESINTYVFDQIPRSVDLCPSKKEDHYYIRSDTRLWSLNVQNMHIKDEPFKTGMGIHCCDLDGNVICSYYKRTEGNFDIYGVSCCNFTSGVMIPIDEYIRLSKEYMKMRAEAILLRRPVENVILPEPFFSEVYFDLSGNYVFFRYATEGVKVFDLKKRIFIYENRNMNDLTNISCCASGVYLIDNKTTYYFDYQRL